MGTSWIIGETPKQELLGREHLAGPSATFLALGFKSCLKTEGKSAV